MNDADFRLVEADPQRHAEAVRAIFNDAILHTTALYEYLPWGPERIAEWFAAKAAGGFPVVAAVDGAERLLGFGSYGVYRARPAYKYTVEHSVYVAENARRRGLGRALLAELVRRARATGLHVLVGGIDASNVASIALHRQLGFEPCGVVRHAGFKFGRWLDVAFWQLILDTPAAPRDG